MALPTYKDIVDLIKKGATIEAQEKIMELREAALGLQEENFTLREKIRALEDELRVKQQLTFERTAYWLDNGHTKDGPFCQRCHDVQKILVRLQNYGTDWFCVACKQSYEK